MSSTRLLTIPLGLALWCVASGGCDHPASEVGDADLTDLFGGEGSRSAASGQASDDGWTVALSPRQFAFPRDHAAHNDFRIEWWYYTGNLSTADGRRFGYQLTFFRTGLNQQPENPSRWAVRDLYTAHFAVSDIDSKRHYCRQRNNRGGLGQAGADSDRFAVWNGAWLAELDGETHRLRAEEDDVEIALTLAPSGPPTLHGLDGLSRKGAEPGNASYYYSLTRMPTEGTIRVGNETFEVAGASWMDHEFSTSFLEPGQLGWDWLSIQLDNGDDLMVYRMRREDGSTDPYSSGTLVPRQGEPIHLTADDYRLEPSGHWRSDVTGAEYPLRWRIQLPQLTGQLEVRPSFQAQEMTTEQTTGIAYWEGAIEVTGELHGQPVAGRGYMELTGYGGTGLGSLIK